MNKEKNFNEPFGWSLNLDIYNCSHGLGNKKDDLQICYDFLDQLPGLIGMSKQGPPVIIVTDAEKYPDKAGLSGWVALVESGIQIHTLIPTRFITLDLYSCKKFNPRAIVYLAKAIFKPQENNPNIESHFFARGKKYGKQSLKHTPYATT